MKLICLILAVLLIIAGVCGTFYYYVKYHQLINNPDNVNKEETKVLTEKVSKIFILPSDEEPTIATVLDKEKLKDQPFFAMAENGDKILIYYKAKKAILYRPQTNKVIEVGPITYGNDDTTTTTAVKQKN